MTDEHAGAMLQWRAASEDDHSVVLAAVRRWWDDSRGLDLANLLPRLFFQYFNTTSIVVHREETLIAFLVGFFSPTCDDRAYVHFIGVDPDLQGRRLGGALYERFFELARRNGRSTVHAITGVSNTRSQDFHRHLGFSISDPIIDYDGPGLDRVVMEIALGQAST